jgi:uncharacterized protein YndB with AHSA1/START domain
MTKLKTLLLLPVLALVPASLLAQSPAPTAAAEAMKLVIEVEVPGPVGEVWRAFSTSAGLSTWLAPDSVVDLRPGGDWICRFPGGSTGGGTILSFIPEKQMVLAAMAPDQFPHVRAQRTTATFQFEPRGSSTVVRLTQTGWKSGDEWTRAYEYLLAGNAQLMSTLHRRFVDGPMDWKKEFADSAAKGK